MSHHEFVTSTQCNQLTFFYDERTRKLSEIQEFLDSSVIEKLRHSIHERTYVVLGGDGLFVHVAKLAHQDEANILGINF